MTTEVEVEDDPTRFGVYSAEEYGRWSLLRLRRGDVIVCDLPEDFVGVSGTRGAFVVMTVGLDIEAGITVWVRSLGGTTAEITEVLSRHFNRRFAYIHICGSQEECGITEEISFHVREVEVHNGRDLEVPWVSPNGKRLLKTVLQEPGETQLEPEEIEEPTPRERGKGSGEASKGDPSKPPKKKSDPHRELREKLEAVKKKAAGGAEKSREEGLGEAMPEVEEVLPSPSVGPQVPKLTGGQKLRPLTEALSRHVKANAGEPAIPGGKKEGLKAVDWQRGSLNTQLA